MCTLGVDFLHVLGMLHAAAMVHTCSHSDHLHSLFVLDTRRDKLNCVLNSLP